jgi:hypothetical protein
MPYVIALLVVLSALWLALGISTRGTSVLVDRG